MPKIVSGRTSLDMVRVLFVRHAESRQQQRLLLSEGRVLRGEVTRREALDRVAELRSVEDINGDPALSENGREQARLFAEYWASVLGEHVRSDKLSVFASPMLRSLETAEQLILALRARFRPDAQAALAPELYEVYGLSIHPADRKRVIARLQELGVLTSEGLMPREMFHSPNHFFPPEFRWTRGGLSLREMRARFAWLSAAPGAIPGAGDDVPWYSGRTETPAERDARTSRLVDWLERLRDELPREHVVLLVTHGELTGRMLNVLFARCFAGRAAGDGAVPMDAGGRGWVGLDPGSNTSVSCLTLMPGQAPRLDFFHRLDHLAPPAPPDTLMRGYQWLGWANARGELRPEGEALGNWGTRARL